MSHGEPGLRGDADAGSTARSDTNGLFPLVLDNVSFGTRDTRIIDRLSVSLSGGRRTVILGANGAGKSVLMRLMHGLLHPTEGTIRWGSHEERPREQAMVFQRPVMLRASALANVAYGLKLAGVPLAERMERAHAALHRVGLSALAHRAARVLSGGEQQRVALARVWALSPRVLFLDEPTASLDPAAATEVERVVMEIAAADCTVVMTTHNLGQARRLAQDIVFIERGRVTEKSPAERFFQQPASPQALAFLKGELP